MNREDIIHMAREAGCTTNEANAWGGFLERFAALVAAAEREACAKVCDDKSQAPFPQTIAGLGFSFSQQWDAARNAERSCAAAIRARGKA